MENMSEKIIDPEMEKIKHKYRPLHESDGDIIMEGDEYLLADCETWERVSKESKNSNLIGTPYSREDFTTFRRKLFPEG